MYVIFVTRLRYLDTSRCPPRVLRGMKARSAWLPSVDVSSQVALILLKQQADKLNIATVGSIR